MAIDLSALFGQQPNYTAFTSAADQQRMQSNASQQALLNAAIALLGQSGTQRYPVSTGQALAGALAAGSEGYNQAFDRTLKQMVTGMQLEEFKRKQRARELASQAFRKEPVPIDMATGQGSQLAMLADPMFGGDMPGVRGQERAITETAATLRANLPMRTIVDRELLAQAAAAGDDFTTAAKILEPKDTLPSDIRSGLAYAQLTPEQKREVDAYLGAKSPKNIIDMTGGQKGFENEMKLRSEFKSEPVYKAFNEMQSAYGQITDSLKKGSPAGDLAGATKFMKLLDPGSVVRESELAMAMAASGLLDRATNYAEMVIGGTKLTPAQRKDFQELADKLYGTAATTYNQKRNEFATQGSQYGLNAERALGAPAKLPKKTITVDY